MSTVILGESYNLITPCLVNARCLKRTKTKIFLPNKLSHSHLRSNLDFNSFPRNFYGEILSEYLPKPLAYYIGRKSDCFPRFQAPDPFQWLTIIPMTRLRQLSEPEGKVSRSIIKSSRLRSGDYESKGWMELWYRRCGRPQCRPSSVRRYRGKASVHARIVPLMFPSANYESQVRLNKSLIKDLKKMELWSEIISAPRGSIRGRIVPSSFRGDLTLPQVVVANRGKVHSHNTCGDGDIGNAYATGKLRGITDDQNWQRSDKRGRSKMMSSFLAWFMSSAAWVYPHVRSVK